MAVNWLWVIRDLPGRICTKAIDRTPNIFLEVLLLRGTMNHCESLSHQLRREIQPRRKINRRENALRNRDGGETADRVQTDDERVREWSEDPSQACRSACSPEDEGKGEHRVCVTFNRPSFDISKAKKKHTSEKTSTMSSRRCLVLRRERRFNCEFMKYARFGKRLIDFIAFVRLKIAGTWKNVVCNKHHVIPYLSEMFRTYFNCRFFDFRVSFPFPRILRHFIHF